MSEQASAVLVEHVGQHCEEALQCYKIVETLTTPIYGTEYSVAF